MIDTVYVEREVAEHPRARAILQRFGKAVVVPIERYGEVFNRGRQNFRLQKRHPALVLAKKHKSHVLPAPYGIGGRRNFYFSHLLNCPYDCRYCFLSGMYRSAHYVLFVNYEDFCSSIAAEGANAPGEGTYFFSGYDGDSLALDAVTGFVGTFVPFFRERSRAFLELRTKSVAIRPLLEHEPFDRLIVAFSFTPDDVHRILEHGVPPVEARVAAVETLARRGFSIGLRFDPLVFFPDYRASYRALFERVFRSLPPESIHSVSLGPFRLPRDYFARMVRLYPEEPLFAGPLEEQGAMISYPKQIEADLRGFCESELTSFLPRERLFPCQIEAGAAAG